MQLDNLSGRNRFHSFKCPFFKRGYFTFVHIEQFSLNFSSSSFVICVYLLDPNHPCSVRFIIISLVFFCLTKLLFSDALPFKGNLNIEGESKKANALVKTAN